MFGFLCLRESVRRGRLANQFVVEPASVVLHFDEDVVAAMESAQRDPSTRGLSRSGARRFVLDSVRDGVADQVDQRIGYLLDDVVVEARVFADQLEIDSLAAHFGGVPSCSRKTRIQ